MKNVTRTMSSSSRICRYTPYSPESWTTKRNTVRRPVTAPRIRDPVFLSGRNSAWKYSEAQLRRHIMELPDALPVPKSVLYNYGKRDPSRIQLSRPPKCGRSDSTGSVKSTSSAEDSGADDLSDVSSEHSEAWDNLFYTDNLAATVPVSQCRMVPALTRVNTDVVPLPLTPPSDLHSRPEWPIIPLSSPSATTVTPSSLSPNVAVSSPHMPNSVSGQPVLHFQCSRCFIIYPYVELIEQHIGQFHARVPEGEHFQLTEENFRTLVNTIWDADFQYFPAGLQQPAAARRPCESVDNYFKFPEHGSIPMDGQMEDAISDEFAGQASLYSTVPKSPVSGESGSEDDSGMDTDDSASYIDEQTAREFDEDVLREIASSNSSLAASCSNSPKKCSSKNRMVFTGKRGNGVTRKLLKQVMREVNKVVAAEQYRKKGKSTCWTAALDMPAELPQPESVGVIKRKRDYTREVVASASVLSKNQKQLRKCRGVYGIDNQSQWCNMCRWKKRCNRFSGADDNDTDE